MNYFGSEDLSVSRITWLGKLIVGATMVKVLAGWHFALTSDCGLENLLDSWLGANMVASTVDSDFGWDYSSTYIGWHPLLRAVLCIKHPLKNSQAVKKGVALCKMASMKKVVKYRWQPRDDCDGRSVRKILIMTIQVQNLPELLLLKIWSLIYHHSHFLTATRISQLFSY